MHKENNDYIPTKLTDNELDKLSELLFWDFED